MGGCLFYKKDSLIIPLRGLFIVNFIDSISQGKPFPLGAHATTGGVNFAIFSEEAISIQLCLFDLPDANSESHRVDMRWRTDGVWHCHIKGIKAGQLYGYRLSGDYDPSRGLRFNAHKIMLDPYALAIGRMPAWQEGLLDYETSRAPYTLQKDTRDNAAYAALAMVVATPEPIDPAQRPQIANEDTILYETHVKSATYQHPDLPREIRGTYLGLCSEPMLAHFKSLGITSLELMPVHACFAERDLIERGLTNYWGYNTLGFFAPDPRFRSGARPGSEVEEFRQMVRVLHAAGLEVILDVVYNHTAEGDRFGPSLSFRGIDNNTYYRLVAEDRSRYQNNTGCGNSLQMEEPRVLQLVLDSLRYWATAMGVDGFRFDLGSSLGMMQGHFDARSAFFQTIMQDPVLGALKFYAEPWDAFESGYHLGGFPYPWAEWNDRFRDSMRGFIRGDAVPLREFAARMAGSDDIFQPEKRTVWASINYITSHDGMCLLDLVTYNQKYNHANGEDNRDGHKNDLSCNHGVEGPTSDSEVRELRQRQMRNLLSVLMLARGVPLLLGGDELMRTRGGNNNAYPLDDETNYWDWQLDQTRHSFNQFVADLITLRKKLRPAAGRAVDQEVWQKNWRWFDADGHALSDDGWQKPERFPFVLVADYADDHTYALLVNRTETDLPVGLPLLDHTRHWLRIFTTERDCFDRGEFRKPADGHIFLKNRSMALFLSEGEHA